MRDELRQRATLKANLFKSYSSLIPSPSSLLLMSDQAGDKRGLTVSLILLFVIAAAAILIFLYVSNVFSPGNSNVPSISPPGFFVGAPKF